MVRYLCLTLSAMERLWCYGSTIEFVANPERLSLLKGQIVDSDSRGMSKAQTFLGACSTEELG
jgi:hypothetical protein